MIKVGGDIKWSKTYERCVVCGGTENRHKSHGYCVKCYPTHKQEIMPVDKCSKCGNDRKGYRDRKTGNFICLPCRASRIKTCYLCEQDKKIHTRIGNGVYVCESCSSKIKDGKCVHCSVKGKIIDRKGEEPICYACDVRPPAVCSVCHQKVRFYKRDEEGVIKCARCYSPSPKKCYLCGKFKTPHQKTSQGHVCEDCYQRPLRECFVCGEHKTGYKKTDDGKYLCRNCYYSTLLEDAIESVKGTFKAEWVEKLFLEYLEDKGRIQSSEIVWKAVERDKPLFDMLGADFPDLGDITVDAFWMKYHGIRRKRIGQLYAFLTDRGYIEMAAMASEDYQRHFRIQNVIDALPEGFRAAAQKYYDRFLTIRGKKLAAGWKETDHGTGSYDTMETIAWILKDLVNELTDAGIQSFAGVTIQNVDEYIADHYSYARIIKRFILWLHQEQQITWKYRGKWKEPKYSTPSPIHTEKYEYLIERLLDDSYPLKESLICLLALVYGIRPKILRKIKVSHLKEKEEKLYLRLPYYELFDLEMHDAIAEKIRRYLHDSFIPNPFDIDNPYLFYGYTYKEPMDEGSMCNIFHKHGVKAHQVLPTMINRLFMEKVRHPAVISKVTGIHKATAVRYYDSYNPAVLEEMNLNRELYGRIK